MPSRSSSAVSERTAVETVTIPYISCTLSARRNEKDDHKSKIEFEPKEEILKSSPR